MPKPYIHFCALISLLMCQQSIETFEKHSRTFIISSNERIYSKVVSILFTNVSLLMEDSTGCSGVSPPHNRSYLDSWSDAMYIPYPDTYLQVSTNAIAFAYYARASADVYLQVFRPAGYMKYTLVASVPHRTRTAGLQTVKVSILLTFIFNIYFSIHPHSSNITARSIRRWFYFEILFQIEIISLNYLLQYG